MCISFFYVLLMVLSGYFLEWGGMYKVLDCDTRRFAPLVLFLI